MSISFKTLADVCRRRGLEWDNPDLPLTFWSTELGGECGEAQNCVKKIERERFGMKGSRATLAQLAEELADTVIAAFKMAEKTGIDLTEAIPEKFNKTSDANGLSVKIVPPDDTEIGRAKQLLRDHGYNVVSNDRVKTIVANYTISNICQVHPDQLDRLVASVRYGEGAKIGRFMVDEGAVWSLERDDPLHMHKEIRMWANVIIPGPGDDE